MMGDTPLEAIALLSCGMKQHQPGRLEGLQPLRERSLGRKASGPHLVVVSVGDLAVFCVDEHPLQPRYAPVVRAAAVLGMVSQVPRAGRPCRRAFRR